MWRGVVRDIELRVKVAVSGVAGWWTLALSGEPSAMRRAPKTTHVWELQR